MTTKVADHYFLFNGLKYFRDGAHLLKLGHVGQKKDKLGAKSYLEPQFAISEEKLAGRVKKGDIIPVDWESTSKSTLEVNGNVKYYDEEGKLKVDGSYEKANSAQLKLISFNMEEGPLTSLLNSDAANARKFMAEEGADARVVSLVFVVVTARLAEKFNSVTSGSLSFTKGSAGLKISGSIGKSGSVSIDLAPGTTFAYALSKVSNWSNNKTRIDDMKRDYHG